MTPRRLAHYGLDAQPTWLILGSKSCQFSVDKGDGSPPPLRTPVSYEPPTPPFTRSVGYCSAFCTSSYTARSSAIADGAGRRGPRRGGVPVS